MPLSNDRGLVAALLQELGKSLLASIETMFVLHKTIQMGMLSSLDDRPAWSANTIGTKAVSKQHPLAGQLVDVGSRIDFFVNPMYLRILSIFLGGQQIQILLKQKLQAVHFLKRGAGVVVKYGCFCAYLMFFGR